MNRSIDAFGGDGPHEVWFASADGEQSLWVKRDLWFDRSGNQSWLVWAQTRAWGTEEPPAEDDPNTTFGSIVVTDPTVMAFLDQLGELIVNPGRFRHEPRFGEPAKEAAPSHEEPAPD